MKYFFIRMTVAFAGGKNDCPQRHRGTKENDERFAVFVL
jgi:hypothetical protein